MGNTFKEFGYDTSNSDYLNLAIDAYNDFFKVIKPDQQPLQWATVKYELGEAYVDLGEQGPGVRYCSKAFKTTAMRSPHCLRTVSLNCGRHSRRFSIALEDLHERD